MSPQCRTILFGQIHLLINLILEQVSLLHPANYSESFGERSVLTVALEKHQYLVKTSDLHMDPCVTYRLCIDLGSQRQT